jgi:hypothetical protein
VTARLATIMAIAETNTGIKARISIALKLIRRDSLKAKSHAPLSRFISLCHCRVGSKEPESASREVLASLTRKSRPDRGRAQPSVVTGENQQLLISQNSQLRIETRSPPGLLTPTLVTLPSMSLIPFAPFDFLSL